MEKYLYHGSSLANIQTLKTLSILHQTSEPVVYLTSNIPYALIYIWDEKKFPQKWITCGINQGQVIYEEQFANQLETFYKGVSGYLYCVDNTENMIPVKDREKMFYSSKNVPVKKAIYIEDVYESLLGYEKDGLFFVKRFTEASLETQLELTERIVFYIIQEKLLENKSKQSLFFKTYFKEAWQLAKTKNRHPR